MIKPQSSFELSFIQGIDGNCFELFSVQVLREHPFNQGRQKSLRGPGLIYVVTALIECLTVLLGYIDLLGSISSVGPRAKCPSCHPPLRSFIFNHIDNRGQRASS